METMTWIERGILAFASAALAISARAAPPLINACAADGRASYGDNADRCRNAEIRRLNPDGSDKGVIPAATQEQRISKDEWDRKQAECEEQKREQYQKDVALLDRYPSEDDLQEARYRALGDELKRISLANDQLKKLFAKGRGFAEQVKFFEPPHQMPEDLRKSRDINREFERIEFQRIAGAAHEIQSINDRFDAYLKRYRELVDGTATRPCDAKKD